MTITSQEFKQANARAKALKASTPAATSAHYDRKSKSIIVKLSTGIGIFFSPQDAQGLEEASPSQLSEIEIIPSGFGLHFPKLDADLYIPALLEGFLGSRNWMASRLGAQGGKARTQAKANASRANGALGGRPRKTVHKSRKHMRGSGVGKIWVADDAFSPETDLEIQKLFEAHDPKFDNIGPKPAKKKRA